MEVRVEPRTPPSVQIEAVDIPAPVLTDPGMDAEISERIRLVEDLKGTLSLLPSSLKRAPISDDLLALCCKEG